MSLKAPVNSILVIWRTFSAERPRAEIGRDYDEWVRNTSVVDACATGMRMISAIWT